MVLQHAHAFPGASLPQLDVARIAAGAGAIALNVCVFLVLLVPAGMPDLAPPTDGPIVVVPIIERTAPPLPPVPVPVIQPVTPVTPAPPTPVHRDVRPVIDQVVIDLGTLPADDIAAQPTDTAAANISPPSGPVAGMRLEYAKAPSPPYPRDALIAGLQGTVLLQVLVDVDGRPLRVDVERSSGHRVLDDAARRYVLRQWTFRPATKDGRPVQALGIVPIAYRLD